MFEIVERFLTISGEAPIIGEPVYLIRFSNCNLQCSYCDTSYYNEINEILSLDEMKTIITNCVDNYSNLKILLTGGEPLLGDRRESIFNLINSLEYVDFYIETNGSIEITNFDMENCHFILDWKSPSSGMGENFFIDNLNRLRIDNDCIKFVVTDEDFDWLKDVIDIIEKINPFLPLYVSPQSYNYKIDNNSYKNQLELIADFILKNHLPLKMSIQLHKIIWQNKDRGV